MSLVVYTKTHWLAFSKLVGVPDLLTTDARFFNQESRTQNAEAMGQFLADHLATKTNQEWLEILTQADIPASPVNDIEDLFEDPHLKAVNLFSDMQHPTEGVLKTSRFPVTFSKTPASIRRLAPNLGEHTQEVLDELNELMPGGEACAGQDMVPSP